MTRCSGGSECSAEVDRVSLVALLFLFPKSGVCSRITASSKRTLPPDFPFLVCLEAPTSERERETSSVFLDTFIFFAEATSFPVWGIDQVLAGQIRCAAGQMLSFALLQSRHQCPCLQTKKLKQPITRRRSSCLTLSTSSISMTWREPVRNARPQTQLSRPP